MAMPNLREIDDEELLLMAAVIADDLRSAHSVADKDKAGQFIQELARRLSYCKLGEEAPRL